MLNLTAPIDAAQLIPHRGSMALVDTLVAFDRLKKSGQVHAILDKNKEVYWTSEGAFAHHWLIEIMAQSAAAVAQAIHLKQEGPALAGFLLTIRNYQLLDHYPLSAGDIIVAHVCFEVDHGPLGHCFLAAYCGALRLAEAQMTFLTPALGDNY